MTTTSPRTQRRVTLRAHTHVRRAGSPSCLCWCAGTGADLAIRVHERTRACATTNSQSHPHAGRGTARGVRIRPSSPPLPFFSSFSEHLAVKSNLATSCCNSSLCRRLLFLSSFLSTLRQELRRVMGKIHCHPDRGLRRSGNNGIQTQILPS